ncbi:RagB/SusD family nutrient uptake outer membrane protein [Chitinophaga silvatica]|uniref:RagB/SusD family nutrient uptake outer membrane protein n=1 Tax=Chitinophaga silvatica TaxID=2282649 RepID=A0A3E1YEX8_9BACT|nr:RagB/SusD family nutrient uptake outer membrane protein [Chitinophaga silvatica]RFS25078.1 RagB/SusD family nutrient uptake outer membrane protein [Chitinophaga silvatica]
MKKWYIIGLLVCSAIGFNSCKKFLQVKPLNVLSGNDYWKTKKDVESAMIGAYGIVLERFKSGIMYNNGDFRAGNWNWFGKDNLRAVGTNRLLNTGNGDNADIPQDWTQFYRAISSTNLAIDRIPGIKDATFSEVDRKRYIAEAKFLRGFIYYYMCKMYGDVPLQTDAYDITMHSREKMLTVLDFVVKDVAASYKDLPLNYEDPSNRAVRGTQGGALALMAHCHMWAAGFDKGKENGHYEATDKLIKELQDLNQYVLLPYEKESYPLIFKGRSEEGIFELSMDNNYNAQQTHSLIIQWTLHEPYIRAGVDGGYGSEITPMRKHMERMYPRGESDKRLTLWFEDPYSESGRPQFPMFMKFNTVTNHDSRDFDANYIFFRYADVLLLRAEALSYLGTNDAEAVKLLNMVRTRAGARQYTGGGGQVLQDAVFFEREKEMMGEGHLWYDLVRTHRILDKNITENYLTQDQFDRGGWTWPISAGAVSSNPLLTRNQYWIQ